MSNQCSNASVCSNGFLIIKATVVVKVLYRDT